MAGNKRQDVLNATLDRALSIAANPNPSAGLEERIVVRLSERKSKSRKRVRAACLILAGMLLGIATLKPVDFLQTEIPVFEPSVALPQVPLSPVEPQIATTVYVLSNVNAQAVPEEELVSDLEIEPLSIAALEVSALEHQ
jgi:hypothetical protein